MSTIYSPTLGSNRYLNDVIDSYIGSYDGVQEYKGMLGRKVALSDGEALNLTNTAAANYSSSTPLKGGVYQLVKMTSTALTIAAARGLAVYWDPTGADNSFQVTTDAPTGKAQFAGVLINALTAGKYGWILTDGMGYIKCKTGLATTGAVGDVMTVDAATGTFNNLAVAPLSVAALTDNSGGTASDTIAAQTGAYVQATQQNTIASLAAKINSVLGMVQALISTGGAHVLAYEAPSTGAFKLAYVRGGIAPQRPGLQ